MHKCTNTIFTLGRLFFKSNSEVCHCTFAKVIRESIMNLNKRFPIAIPKFWKKVCASRLRFFRRAFFLATPHLLAIAILIAYLFIGSYVFCTIEGWDASAIRHIYNISSLETELRNGTDLFLFERDPNMTSDLIARVKRDIETSPVDKPVKRIQNRQVGWNMFDGILFAYSTVTTIGYNDLTPSTTLGRFFYILYAIVGVPICTLVLVDWALFVEELSFALCRFTKLGRLLLNYDIDRYSSFGSEMVLLAPLALALFLLYIFLGALLLRLYESGWTLADGFYASFDAVTTIGIGDIRPNNHHYYPLTMVYVTVGIAVSSTCLSLIITDLARIVHYSGRKIGECASKTIYFGSRRVRVEQLIRLVAKEWAIDEVKVRQLTGRRLDKLIKKALKNKERNSDFSNGVMESSL